MKSQSSSFLQILVQERSRSSHRSSMIFFVFGRVIHIPRFRFALRMPKRSGRQLECFGRAGGLLLLRRFHRLAHFRLDFVGERRIGLEELLDRVAALSEFAVAVGEPRTALLDDSVIHAEVDDLADLGDSLAEDDVELGLLEKGVPPCSSLP